MGRKPVREDRQLMKEWEDFDPLTFATRTPEEWALWRSFQEREDADGSPTDKSKNIKPPHRRRQ